MTDNQTPMTRTALVSTDVPGRWAKQLASHLGRPGKMAVEVTEQGPRLSMTFDGVEATCLMDTTGAGVLALRADAAGEAALDRMAHVVGSHLERFGEKAGLQVSWG
jgi:uncharacterized protein